MKTMLKLEESAMFLFSIYLFSQLNFSWWWYLALILLPDISMAGYAVNNKTGAICYNIAHHKGVALMVYVAGLYLHDEKIQLVGIILFGHASMDRIMGYGLKYEQGFKYTHLGDLGK